MRYRDILGFSKPKKKVIKEQSKPKKTVLDGIKKDILNEWHHQPPTEKRWSGAYGDEDGLTEFEKNGGKDIIKEVGMSQEIKMYTHAINKNYDRYWDSVKDLQKYLAKKGAQKVSKQIGSLYTGHVGKFHHWMKTKFVQMVRKMI